MQQTSAMGCNGIQWDATAYNRLWYFYNVTFLQRGIFTTNLSSEKILLTNHLLMDNARARSIIIRYLGKNDLPLAIPGESPLMVLSNDALTPIERDSNVRPIRKQYPQRP